MFNFSFDDQDEATAAELSKSSAMYFEFEVGLSCVKKEDMPTLHSRSWEISRFNISTIRRRSARASRACLPTSPASVSTRWWASPLRPCPPSRSTAGLFCLLCSPNLNLCLRCLNTLEVYVDNIFVVNRQMTLDQAAQETFNPPWPSLKSLKLGGMVRIANLLSVWKASHVIYQMTTGSVLKYLLEGCLNIRVLCYSLYEDQVGNLRSMSKMCICCCDRSTLWRTPMSSSCFSSTRCLPSSHSTLRSVFSRRRWNYCSNIFTKQKIDGILQNMDRWKPDWNILEFLPSRPSTPKSSLPWHPLRVSCFHNSLFPISFSHL